MMCAEHAPREGGAAEEIESQTVLGAQVRRVFGDKQFTVNSLGTPFRHPLERMKDLVTQLRDETVHELYARVR